MTNGNAPPAPCSASLRAELAALCKVPATLKATGAAKSPDNPIQVAFPWEAALPKARPTQTMTDQEIFCTRSAIIFPIPNVLLNPTANRIMITSITSPNPTASQATRNNVAPKFALPSAGIAEEFVDDTLVSL